MRAFVRNSLLAVLIEAVSLPSALAGARGTYLPPIAAGPGGEDSIETGSGTRCRQSINSNGAYLDMGVVGSAASPIPRADNPLFIDDRDREAMAYARVTIPLGKRPSRIDCSTVYQLEIQRLKQELELLRMNAE